MSNAEKFWDRASVRSGNNLGQSDLKIIAHTKVLVSAHDDVLDFGCGPGTITNEIARNVKSITAVDTSSGMIEAAETKARTHAIKNVNYSQTTLFDIRLGKDSFDVVLAFNVLPYVDDLAETTKRIHHLLKTGGLYISSTACLGEKRSFTRALVYFLAKARIVPRIRFYTAAELEHAITKSNFEIIQTEEISGLPEHFVVARKT